MTKAKTFALATTLAVALAATLAGCSVSDSDRAECEARSGHITETRYPFQSTWLGESRTGKLITCSSDSGTILKVYNEEIAALDDGGLFGPSGANRQVFEECQELGGITYKTQVKSGKTYTSRYACVFDGEYRRILD